MLEEFKKPDDTLTITVNGAPRQLLMSAGLIRTLVNIVGGFENAGNVYLDPALQEILMIETLRPRKPDGKPEDPAAVYTLFDFVMTATTGKELVAWLGGHVVSFFTEGAADLQKAVALQMKISQSLTSSANGTQDLRSDTRSVGDMIGAPIEK